MEIIAERLKEVRDAAGHSQAGIAKAVGMQQGTWSDWERSPPRQLQWLANLSRQYGVSADYILGLTDDSAPANGRDLPSHVPDILALARQLPESRRQELRALAALMLETAQREERRIELTEAFIERLGEERFLELADLVTDGVNRVGAEAAFVQLERWFADLLRRESGQEVFD